MLRSTLPFLFWCLTVTVQHVHCVQFNSTPGLSAEETRLLAEMPAKEFRELEGFNAFAKAVLREERNTERDRLLERMTEEELELRPDFFALYQRERAHFQAHQARPAALIRANETLTLRMRFLLYMDVGIKSAFLRGFLNRDRPFTRMSRIIAADLPLAWQPPKNVDRLSAEHRRFVMHKFAEAFAERLRERKHNPDFPPLALDFHIPEEIRAELLKGELIFGWAGKSSFIEKIFLD